MIILQAEWSQRPVLKSNLQTPTWLLLISHGLFITAITSPHVFILLLLLLLHCCWPALLSLFLHLADLTSLPPSLLPLLIYSHPFSPFLALFRAPFLNTFSHLLFPSTQSLFFHLHLWMHSFCPCLFDNINLLHTYGPNNCRLLQQSHRIFIHSLWKADMIPSRKGVT